VRPDACRVSQVLPDGLLLRSAKEADLDQIGELLVERGEPADALDHRLVVEDPDAGLGSCAVVVDGDRVVSTATLLDEVLVLEGLPIPAGQVELVATDRAYEGRGLVRALMAWAHARSAARGHLAQVMIGIPYFYRKFGYQYAIELPHNRAVTSVPPAPEDHLVRPAGPADIAAMAALQEATQRGFDLRMPRSAACWRWLVARTGSTQLLVERAGVPVGTARITPPDEDVLLGEIAVEEPSAVSALLAYSAKSAKTSELKVKGRPGSLAGAALEPYLADAPPLAECYYARVPDARALLEHLRPVLSARLQRAGLGAGTGEVVVSFFGHHVRMPYVETVVQAVNLGGVLPGPASVGGAGVAPDLVGPLLFGQQGIIGLALRHPDVYPGPNRDLMGALFPPLSADLLTFYLP